jgi:hypothetical protein
VLYKLAQLHIEYPETEHKQLKLIALAKGVKASSLARSYIQRGINDALNSTTTKVGKSTNHLPQLQLCTPALNFQEQRLQTTIQLSPSSKSQPEYPKPGSSSELNEWHRRFFSECFLQSKMQFFDNPSGTYDPYLLMALVSKPELIKCMLERGKNQKLFRVYNALVKLIINKMINEKIIVRIRGDLLASPMILLEKIVKIGVTGLTDGGNNQAASHTSVMISELGANQDNTSEINTIKEDLEISNSNIKEAGN